MSNTIAALSCSRRHTCQKAVHDQSGPCPHLQSPGPHMVQVPIRSMGMYPEKYPWRLALTASRSITTRCGRSRRSSGVCTLRHLLDDPPHQLGAMCTPVAQHIYVCSVAGSGKRWHHTQSRVQWNGSDNRALVVVHVQPAAAAAATQPTAAAPAAAAQPTTATPCSPTPIRSTTRAVCPGDCPAPHRAAGLARPHHPNMPWPWHHLFA